MAQFSVLLTRDCYAQVKAARRNLLMLIDDLGDLIHLTKESKVELESMYDELEKMSQRLESFRDTLRVKSEK